MELVICNLLEETKEPQSAGVVPARLLGASEKWNSATGAKRQTNSGKIHTLEQAPRTTMGQCGGPV